MANRSKDKGDAFERAALAYLLEVSPLEMLVSTPQRELGAGRRLDRGDLHVLVDAAVQVKAFDDTVRAVAQAAAGALRQAENREVRHSVGLVPVMRARKTSVHWLAATLAWPGELGPQDFPVVGQSGAAIRYVRDDSAGVPREQRVALVRRASFVDLWVATPEAWLTTYAAAVRASWLQTLLAR